MRPSPALPLLMVAAWLAAPLARAQPAATQPAPIQPATAQSGAPHAAPRSAVTQLPAARQTAAQPDAAQAAADTVRPSRRSSSRHPRPRPVRGGGQRSVTESTAAGVSLGATDITGNKELPKVMVIVPWKDSLGAGGVVKPTDSLLDQMLEPVDRGVFQRQIHYYGQLNTGEARPAAPAKVAPVGDSR